MTTQHVTIRAADLIHACTSCQAPARQYCRTRPRPGHPDSYEMTDRVHEQARFGTNDTGQMTVLSPLWGGQERRRWTEAQVRADERQAVALRLTAHVAGRLHELSEDEQRVAHQLIDVAGSGR